MLYMNYNVIPFTEEIHSVLTFPNPFEPLEEFRGYYLDKEYMVVPRHTPGLTQSKMTLVSRRININVSSEFTLRPYQVEPAQEIVEYFGGYSGECLLRAATGSGKSFSLGYIISQVGQRTLILAHLSMLTDQMYDELSKNLDGDVRILDAKNQELGDVNICTFNYLHSNPDMVDLLTKEIGFVVVDECENLLSKTRLDIYLKLNPKYQLLMSATPTKELTGRTPMIRYLIGNNIVIMEPTTQIEPKFVMLDYRDLQFHSPQAKMLYKGALTRFMMSSRIPADVIDLCKELAELYGCTWIIIDSLKFQDMMASMLEDCGLSAEVIRGSTNKKERARILTAIADRQCRFLLASAPLSAGISIPELAFAFRLMPHSSSKELLNQQIGRLKRVAEFKKEQECLWFDLAIEGSLAYNGKDRMRKYKQEGSLLFRKAEKIKGHIKDIVQKD